MHAKVNTIDRNISFINGMIMSFYFILLILLIIRLLYGIYIIFVPSSLYETYVFENGTISIAPATLNISFSSILHQSYFRPLDGIANPKISHIINLWCETMSYLMTFYILHLLKNIFTNIEKNNTPFTYEITSNIKKCGIIIIFLSIVPETIKVILFSIFDNGIFLLPGNINLFITFTGIILLWISAIFNYGCILQESYDETV